LLEISAASDKSGLREAKAEQAKLKKNVAKYRRNINTLQIQLAEERSLADTSQHKSGIGYCAKVHSLNSLQFFHEFQPEK